MKDFLRKIKLITSFTTELRISKQDFVERLSAITNEGSTGLFSGTFDIFSSNKKEYKGSVTFDEFQLKRRQKAFDTSYNFCTAKGILSENNGQLTIETEINGFNNWMTIFFLFFILLFSIIIFTALSNSKTPAFLFPVIFFQGALVCTLPFLAIRRSVERLKYDLEREFFYLTKND
jgi:hypothetical protein